MKMITDFMWKEIKPLIPTKKSKVGRPPMPSRKVLDGIFYVVKTGVQWKYLPKEFGPSSTIHGRFREWIKQGVFKEIMKKSALLYLEKPNEQKHWYAIDASSCKSPFAHKSGRNPTDRGKRGMKKSIIVDFRGAPLSVVVGPANTHDSKYLKETFEKLVSYDFDGIKILSADSAYDVKKLKEDCSKSGFLLLAATNVRRNKNREIYKPACRWIVERTFGWLAWYRGLKTCWTKTTESFQAFLELVSSVHLFRMKGIFG